jgi:hypothetical protein
MGRGKKYQPEQCSEFLAADQSGGGEHQTTAWHVRKPGSWSRLLPVGVRSTLAPRGLGKTAERVGARGLEAEASGREPEPS